MAAFVFAAIGCSQIKGRFGGSDDSAQREEPLADSSIAVIDFDTEYFLVPEKIPEKTGTHARRAQVDWETIDSLRRANPEVDSVTSIFRVQLFASQYYSEAGFQKEIAEATFDDPVYLVYDVPYYKVLMGNYTSRVAGERRLRHAHSYGFENGWLVESPPDSIYYESVLPPDSVSVGEDSPSGASDDSIDN